MDTLDRKPLTGGGSMYRLVSFGRTLVVACFGAFALAAAADDESARLENAKLILVESGQYAATEVVMQQALGSALAPLRGQLEPASHEDPFRRIGKGNRTFSNQYQAGHDNQNPNAKAGKSGNKK